MKFQCPSCQVSFSVPDEKVPGGKGFRILCPKCRAPIEVKDPAEAESLDEHPLATGAEPSATSSEGSELDMVDEGVRTALLCVSNEARADVLRQVLIQLDFFVVSALRAPVAMGKLHTNHYDVVLLEELFDAKKPTDNLVLHHIQLLPMHVRRQFFLCLLSDTLPSLDPMLAFRLCVDMILNTRDLEKAKIILVRAMKEHKSFYRIFADELGKKA